MRISETELYSEGYNKKFWEQPIAYFPGWDG
jgi:hypothetical protein